MKSNRNEYYKKWCEQNRDKARAIGRKSYKKNANKQWARKLKQVYGLTVEEYNKLLNDQQELCAICKVHQSAEMRRFCVDHSHRTGAIRGLLCRTCNSGLGQFKDSLTSLENALDYLNSKEYQ